jgi:hypothetical protein
MEAAGPYPSSKVLDKARHGLVDHKEPWRGCSTFLASGKERPATNELFGSRKSHDPMMHPERNLSNEGFHYTIRG